jgi:hypothetical protein
MLVIRMRAIASILTDPIDFSPFPLLAGFTEFEWLIRASSTSMTA